jgi:hypothetical protein
MIAPAKFAAAMILAAFLFLTLAFLTGCSSLGPLSFSVQSDYGRFSYQLPEMPSRTLKDK